MANFDETLQECYRHDTLFDHTILPVWFDNFCWCHVICFFRQCATVTPACSNFVHNDFLNLILLRLAGKAEINGMYYCENLTCYINDITYSLQIDKAFYIGQLLTHVSWSEQSTECFPSMCSSPFSETSVKEISFKI